jgi:hypothetical protein
MVVAEADRTKMVTTMVGTVDPVVVQPTGLA